jgi:hypothetical protein
MPFHSFLYLSQISLLFHKWFLSPPYSVLRASVSVCFSRLVNWVIKSVSMFRSHKLDPVRTVQNSALGVKLIICDEPRWREVKGKSENLTRYHQHCSIISSAQSFRRIGCPICFYTDSCDIEIYYKTISFWNQNYIFSELMLLWLASLHMLLLTNKIKIDINILVIFLFSSIIVLNINIEIQYKALVLYCNTKQ